MDTKSLPHTSSSAGAPHHREREDWEDWESEGVVTPIEPTEQVLIDTPTSAAPNQASRSSISKPNRYSTAKIKRLKSRHRQKAQNAKAGIRLITDMTVLRRQNPTSNQIRTPNGRPVKFVDAAALRALEGEPTSASVGNWNWLRKARGQSPASASPQNSARTLDQELSPEDRPIVIGISLPSDVADSRQISPQTADVNTPSNPFSFNNPYSAPKLSVQASTTSLASSQAKSVWSPDTPDTANSFNSPQNSSSIYSRVAPGVANPSASVSPLSTVPNGPKKPQHQRLISLELGGNGADDDDGGTPCTLFEEDGIPSPLKQSRSKAMAATPDSAGSRTQGWWDHVVTPFTEKRLTFSNQKQRLESPREEDEDRLVGNIEISEKRPLTPTYTPSPILIQAPIVRAPTPRRTPSPRPATTTQIAPAPLPVQPASSPSTTTTQEKPRIVVTDESPSDSPPPYSPPKRSQQGAPVRYRAVFPPSHPLNAQFPPSPGPVSPGFTAAMTAQGATQMADIPLSPSSPEPTAATLPARPAGAHLPMEHTREVPGRAKKIERQRRRHEKEDVIARRVGGLWRGRGCIPATGCFGRSGREGRQKRRVRFGILGAVLALVILAIVLAVVLTRRADPKEVESIWVNLTDFPPMPTGVLTVVAPDNSVARSSCTSPSTLWSCALPKEEHESVAPANPDQPTMVMQIQWDNSSRNSWKVPNGTPPPRFPRRAIGLAARASSMIQARQETDFEPVPSPPSFGEMWFLGDTTDDIKSEDKAGEPTPFYISLIGSVEDTAETPKIDRRQSGVLGKVIDTEPEVEEDGTPKPAVLLPRAKQQPVRLFDRGLPTEHYGFYMYYKRTIFLRSVNANDTAEGDIPIDKDGGARKTEANFQVTWAQTRLLVRIWTRTLDENTSSLLRSDVDSVDGQQELIRPGTMPYPVTMTMDTHGGDPEKKAVWWRAMNDRQQLDVSSLRALSNKLDVGGSRFNPRNRNETKFGGFDGGTGGCKCEWVNWIQRS